MWSKKNAMNVSAAISSSWNVLGDRDCSWCRPLNTGGFLRYAVGTTCLRPGGKFGAKMSRTWLTLSVCLLGEEQGDENGRKYPPPERPLVTHAHWARLQRRRHCYADARCCSWIAWARSTVHCVFCRPHWKDTKMGIRSVCMPRLWFAIRKWSYLLACSLRATIMATCLKSASCTAVAHSLAPIVRSTGRWYKKSKHMLLFSESQMW